MARQHGDAWGKAAGLLALAGISGEEGDHNSARSGTETARQVALKADLRALVAASTGYLANLETVQGNVTAARALYREAAAIYDEIGDEFDAAIQPMNLGDMLRQAGRPKQSRRLIEKSAQVFERNNDRMFAANCHGLLGRLAYEEENLDLAEMRLRFAIAEMHDLGALRDLVLAARPLAAVLCAQGRLDDAVTLSGALDAEAERLRVIADPVDETEFRREQNQLRSKLPSAAWNVSWKTGHSLGLDAVLEMAYISA